MLSWHVAWAEHPRLLRLKTRSNCNREFSNWSSSRKNSRIAWRAVENLQPGTPRVINATARVDESTLPTKQPEEASPSIATPQDAPPGILFRRSQK